MFLAGSGKTYVRAEENSTANELNVSVLGFHSGFMEILCIVRVLISLKL